MGFFRNIFGGGSQPSQAQGKGLPRIPRRSTGFQQFTRYIVRPDGQRVLDLGPTSPNNLGFITGLGHKAYNDDILTSSKSEVYMGTGPDGTKEFEMDRFMTHELNYESESFDAVLLWDVCDYLPESLVKPVVDRIYRITKPGGILLGFFHTKDAGPDAPYFRYHIMGEDSLELQQGPHFQLQRVFQNRHVENLFREYASIKFFLGKENIREVLIVR